MHPFLMPDSRLADSTSTIDASTTELVALVAAARAGDRVAFGTLYERYARFVHGVLLAHAQRDDVPDLLQDVFFRALRQLHTLRDAQAFAGWLAMIARNEARMRYRAEKLTEELSDQLPAREAEHPGRELGVDELLGVLRSLPERYREPLTLRLVQQMGGEAIARTLGLSHGTVRVYLHHGMRLLREQLGDAND